MRTGRVSVRVGVVLRLYQRRGPASWPSLLRAREAPRTHSSGLPTLHAHTHTTHNALTHPPRRMSAENRGALYQIALRKVQARHAGEGGGQATVDNMAALVRVSVSVSITLTARL